MTSVPANLTFDQQVAIASGEAHEAAQLYVGPPAGRAAAIGQNAGHAANRSECPWLDKEVRDLDAAARRPLPGWQQDEIRKLRIEVMSRRAAFNC
jgi:hypothetical protein